MSHFIDNKPTNYLDVSKNSLIQNAKEFKKLLLENTELMAVLKCDAYGIGIANVVNSIDEYINLYAVDSLADALTVTKKSDAEIMIMAVLNHEDFITAIENDIVLSIGSMEVLSTYLSFLPSEKSKLKIQVKINTGLNRYGFNEEELEDLISILRSRKEITLVGIYSHLQALVDEDKMPAYEDAVKIFDRSRKVITDYIDGVKWFHIGSSGAVFLFPDQLSYNLVRCGGPLYGYCAYSQHLQQLIKMNIALHPAVSLHTTVSQIRYVEEGDIVGYAGSSPLEKRTKVAVLPIGYAHGMPRAFNKGKFYVNGHNVPVIGKIAMNSMMIDITSVETLAVGDRLTILDNEENNKVIYEMAELENTSVYDLLLRFSNSLEKFLVS